MRLQLPEGFRRGEILVAGARRIELGNARTCETNDADAIKVLMEGHGAVEFHGDIPEFEGFGGKLPDEMAAEVERQREITRNEVAAKVEAENKAVLKKRDLARIAGEPVPDKGKKG
jgi:hypothetical protein